VGCCHPQACRCIHWDQIQNSFFEKKITRESLLAKLSEEFSPTKQNKQDQ
jgi:CRISPR/Cas system-associated endoribonuclease Cas2